MVSKGGHPMINYLLYHRHLTEHYEDLLPKQKEAWRIKEMTGMLDYHRSEYKRLLN
jgi:hypothetical protein